MASYKSVVMLSLCCAAQTVFADFCSDQKGIENFNFTAFQGVWYFAYKYGTRISVSFGDACVKSDHTRTKNGFEVFLEYYDSKKKKQSFVADVPLMKEGGSYFEVNSKEQNMHMYTVLLETDYENYLTEFFCLRGQMAEGYIRTRSRNPSPEILRKAKEAAKQMDAFSLGSYLAIQPKHIILLGGTVFTVGLLKSALALLAVFCTPIVVRLCNEKNRQNVMAWCILVSVFGDLLSSRTSSVLVYFISRLICVASVPVQTVLKGTVAEYFESIEESSKILRRLGHIGTVGFIIGRVVGGHLADYDRGTEYVYTSMAACNLISIVLVKSLPDTRPKKPKKTKKAKDRTRKDASILKEALMETSSVFKNVKETAAHPEYGNAFAAKVCVECATVMNLMALGTTLAGEFKMSVANVGHVFVLNMAVAMVAARWLVAEDGPARRTVSFSTCVQVVGLVALAWVAHPSTFVAVTVVTAMAKPCVDAAVQKDVKGQPRPLRRAFGRTVPFAHIVGPVVAGTASRVFGNRSGFLICALLTLLADRLIEPFGLPKVSRTK